MQTTVRVVFVFIYLFIFVAEARDSASVITGCACLSERQEIERAEVGNEVGAERVSALSPDVPSSWAFSCKRHRRVRSEHSGKAVYLKETKETACLRRITTSPAYFKP